MSIEESSKSFLSLLEASKDKNMVKHVEPILYNILQQENFSEICFLCFLNTQDDTKRSEIMVYLHKFIKDNIEKFTDGQIARLFEKMKDMFQNTENLDIKRSISQSLYFLSQKRNISEEIFNFAKDVDPQSSLVLVNLIIKDLPPELLRNNVDFFVNICLINWKQYNIGALDDISRVFLLLSDNTNDINVINTFTPIFEHFNELIINENEKANIASWVIISECFKYDIVTEEQVIQLINMSFEHFANTKIHIVSEALEEISAHVEKFGYSCIEHLIRMNAAIAENIYVQESVLSDANFTMVSELLIKCKDKQIDKILLSILERKIENRESKCCMVPLFFAKFLLLYSPRTLIGKIDEVIKFFISNLDGDDIELKRNTLAQFCSCDEWKITSDFSSSFVPLLKAIVPFLIVDDAELRQLSYQSLITLIDCFDDEIENFIDTIWDIRSKIFSEDISHYVNLMGVLISQSNDVTDDHIEEIVNYVLPLVNSGDVNIQCQSLSVFSAIMIQQGFIFDEYLEIGNKIVKKAFDSEDTDDDSLKSIMSFFNNLLNEFKDEVICYVESYIESIFKLMSEKSSDITSDCLHVICTYIGQKRAVFHIEEISKYIMNLLKSEDVDKSIEGCNYICLIYRTLFPVQENDDLNNLLLFICQELYNIVKHIIKTSDDFDLIDNALIAIRKLIKAGYSGLNRSFYVEDSALFIRSMIEGGVHFIKCEGSVSVSYPIIESLAELIGKMFKLGTPILVDLLNFLFNWTKVADEIELFSIVGAICDAIEFTDVSKDVPLMILEFIVGNIREFSSVDLIRNISYMFSLLVNKYEESIGVILDHIDVIVSWWRNGVEINTGYQETLSNIASLFLTLKAHNIDISDDIVVMTIDMFPPADLEETSDQAEYILKILSFTQSQKIMLSSVFAFSKLISEGNTKITKRKMSQELFDRIVIIFKQICNSNQDIMQQVLSRYERNKKKKELILNALK